MKLKLLRFALILLSLLLVVSSLNLTVLAAPLREARPLRPERPEYVAGEILVKFSGEEKAKVVRLPRFKSVEQAIGEYGRRYDVEYAEPNYIAHAFMVPNDPYYSYQWHFTQIKTESAWDVSWGEGVKVAIIDTGIAYEDYCEGSRWRQTCYEKASDFAATCFVPGYDFVNSDTHPNDDSSPGHGTHVAGTVSQSTNNGVGVAGIAFKSCLMPIKVLGSGGSGTYANVADGIRWAADNGAKIINLSLGGSADSQTLKDAVAYAYGKGVTVVAAAGNDGKNKISYPAAYDDYVIAVGATRFDETLAYYSNYGSSLDLVAPGGDLNVDQSGDGYADGVLQQTYENSGWRGVSWGYYFLQGTSMAAPHVAGVAAMVIANGVSGPDNIRQILESSAKDLGDAGRDDTFGHGLLDAATALGTTPSPPPPPPENQPPVADAGPDKSIYVGDTATFDGSGSSDPDGEIVSYGWDFGDGSSASGVTVGHIYDAVGTYTATLTVTDDEGLTTEDTAVVEVSEKPALSTMHVGDITFGSEVRSWGRWGSSCRVTVTVPVLDSTNVGVGSASVAGSWSGAYRRDVSGSTGSGGTVSFQTGWVRGCGTFTFTVNNVSKTDWLYDPTANFETSDSITP